MRFPFLRSAPSSLNLRPSRTRRTGEPYGPLPPQFDRSAEALACLDATGLAGNGSRPEPEFFLVSTESLATPGASGCVLQAWIQSKRAGDSRRLEERAGNRLAEQESSARRVIVPVRLQRHLPGTVRE